MDKIVVFRDVKILRSKLADAYLVPQMVDVYISKKSFSLYSNSRKVVSWSLGSVKKYGIEEDICSMEFGHTSSKPGVLYMNAGEQTGSLFRRCQQYLLAPAQRRWPASKAM